MKDIVFQNYLYKERRKLMSQIFKDVGNLVIAILVIEPIFTSRFLKIEVIIWGAIVSLLLYWSAIKRQPRK